LELPQGRGVKGHQSTRRNGFKTIAHVRLLGSGKEGDSYVNKGDQGSWGKGGLTKKNNPQISTKKTTTRDKGRVLGKWGTMRDRGGKHKKKSGARLLCR